MFNNFVILAGMVSRVLSKIVDVSYNKKNNNIAMTT
jgi:hypothetical protein